MALTFISDTCITQGSINPLHKAFSHGPITEMEVGTGPRQQGSTVGGMARGTFIFVTMTS